MVGNGAYCIKNMSQNFKWFEVKFLKRNTKVLGGYSLYAELSCKMEEGS